MTRGITKHVTCRLLESIPIYCFRWQKDHSVQLFRMQDTRFSSPYFPEKLSESFNSQCSVSQILKR
uniref:Uncharacterized protein n=1 Tax=Arundo donax TaxID=35708 RepID=A0A0A9SV15_ARUDO